MSGPATARRFPFSFGAAGVIIGCYSTAGVFAAVVPGLHGSGRTVAVGLVLGCLAGAAAWLAAPRLTCAAPPLLPPPPVRTHPETERLARRLRFDQQLERALDATDGDDAALYAVTARALDSIPPSAPAELLLAGPQRTKLVQVAEAGPDGEGPGCPVAERLDCPAIRRDRTLRFSSSDDLDACPHLTNRDGRPCAAVCVPVRVLGEVRGVLHRTSPPSEPPTDLDVSYLESLSTKLEAQLTARRLQPDIEHVAATDRATGLLTRRAMEDRIGELARTLTPFTLAQCDIDHFAAYTDRHGPDAAAAARGALARAARRCLRPADSVGQGGGDELLAIFPDTRPAAARRALERLREELALELTEGCLPPFTVSIGVIDADVGRHLDELLEQADLVTAVARQRGCNRVVLAGEIGVGDTPSDHRP